MLISTFDSVRIKCTHLDEPLKQQAAFGVQQRKRKKNVYFLKPYFVTYFMTESLRFSNI